LTVDCWGAAGGFGFAGAGYEIAYGISVGVATDVALLILQLRDRGLREGKDPPLLFA
jgi:uncharacterized membrane protein YdfJ with MMPL/SSD domain